MAAVESEVLRRSLPPGGTTGYWLADDGWRLRVGVWPDGARGTLLLLNGRADFFEKYCEAIWHWRARGWAVVAPDWRGQGGSGRIVCDGRGDGFARLAADLRGVVARAAALGGPLVAVGHSMGGHLLLRAIVEGEDRVARAVLIAPMLGLLGGEATSAVAWGAVRLGLGARMVAPRAARSPEEDARRAARLTSDSARQTDEAWWLARHPELAGDGVSWGWLAVACGSIARLGAGGRIARPERVRAVLAGADRVVDRGAARRLIARRIGAEGMLDDVPGAEHELLRETDAVRARVFACMDTYLEQA